MVDKLIKTEAEENEIMKPKENIYGEVVAKRSKTVKKKLTKRYPDPMIPNYVNIASFQINDIEFTMDLGVIDYVNKRDEMVADMTHRFVMSRAFLETFISTLNGVYEKNKKNE